MGSCSQGDIDPQVGVQAADTGTSSGSASRSLMLLQRASEHTYSSKVKPDRAEKPSSGRRLLKEQD